MGAAGVERLLTGILATAAMALAGIALHREFSPPVDARSVSERVPTAQEDWKDALSIGIRIGESTAKVTMVIFSDLECPGCAAFHETVLGALRKHPKDLSVVFVHLPISGHRFALAAAQAAECANSLGRFDHFIDAVYAKQDSLGLKSWGSYAGEAGISDTAFVARCARNPDPSGRIEAGRELALRWEVRGTPTVIINGRRYQSPPTEDDVERSFQEVMGSVPSP